MARTARRPHRRLVEIKAVDARLSALRHGRDRSGHAACRTCSRSSDGAFGAAVDPALLTRLDLKPGDRITIGNATIELRAALTGEPDKLAGGIGFGPRLLISEAALRATGLLQPGSLVRWHYRLRLPPADASDRAVDGGRRSGAGRDSRRRLGDPHPHQRVAAARAQCRALHPVPHAGRPDRAAGRRRRRRQCGRRAISTASATSSPP